MLFSFLWQHNFNYFEAYAIVNLSSLFINMSSTKIIFQKDLTRKKHFLNLIFDLEEQNVQPVSIVFYYFYLYYL